MSPKERHVRTNHRSIRLVAAAATAALVLAACGGDDAADTDTADDITEDAPEDDATEDDGADEMTEDEDAAAEGDEADLTAANLGEACALIPEDGDGSAEGMSQDPVATAASNNPLLTTLASLVEQAELADTLNGLEGATVFAPTDDAFAQLQEDDPELFEAVSSDPDLLATVLTYHVIGDQELNAEELLEAETATTVAEQDVTIVEGGAEGVQIEAAGGNTADVICGNVATANATVHVIDDVLLPDVG
jgi:uncharacterized surface protein with fasciclin (FAS1) repeats